MTGDFQGQLGVGRMVFGVEKAEGREGNATRMITGMIVHTTSSGCYGCAPTASGSPWR